MLSNKIVVVTGGAGLLGHHFCRSIAEHHGLAIVADIDMTSAERVAEAIQKRGGRADAAELDITDPDSVDSLIADINRRHRRIDSVVNSAYPHNCHWGPKT